MIKGAQFPLVAPSNWNILEIINFETYELLPHSSPWIPFPALLSNQNRQISLIAWHSRYPTVYPHSFQYRLLRSLSNGDLQQVIKVLKKAEKQYPGFINRPIDKKYHYTPLQYACIKNNYPAIELLLLYGANINLPDKEGNTPIMIAVMNESLESINSLIKYGCDWRIKNKYGISPEQRANKMGKEFISQFIRQFGINQHLEAMRKNKVKNPKIPENQEDMIIKRKFPRFKVALDIQHQTKAEFWKFVPQFTKLKTKIIRNPFNNLSGEYRISFNNFQP